MSCRSSLCRFSAVLLLALPLISHAAVYKCDDGNGGADYRDQPCANGQPLAIAPAPATRGPAYSAGSAPSHPPSPQSKAARARRQADLRDERKDAAHKKKCDKLALRRQWADQDMQAARGMVLRPQDKKLDNAQRKARRMEEQFNLECGGNSGA